MHDIIAQNLLTLAFQNIVLNLGGDITKLF